MKACNLSGRAHADEGRVQRSVVTLATPLTDGTVLLRRPCDEDVDVVYAYGQDPALTDTLWLPLPVPCPRAVAAQTLREFQQGWQGDGRFGLTFAITMPPASDLRGVAHLFHAEGAVGEIAYGVAPPYRRRGVASRAVALLAAWASAQRGLDRLEIRITARGSDGVASQRVAEKTGFVYAGIRRSRVPATGATFDDKLYALDVRR